MLFRLGRLLKLQDEKLNIDYEEFKKQGDFLLNLAGRDGKCPQG